MSTITTRAVKGGVLSWAEGDANFNNLNKYKVETTTNITSLRGLSGTEDTTYVFIEGFTTSGDKGGGPFYWDAASVEVDDGATIIQPTGVTTGRWKRDSTEGELSIRQFGAVGDGSTDDSAIINTAFIYGGANKITIRVPDGDFNCTSRLELVSNLTVLCDNGAKFRIGLPTSGTNGFLRQNNFDVKISNVKWTGGTIYGVDIATSTGNTVIFNGDDIHIEELTIDTYGGPGRAFFIAGDRIHLHKITCKNPLGGAGTGGIRYLGGKDFLCTDSWVHSGDDCFQFVTGENTLSPSAFTDKDIENGTYSNCYGISDTSRVIIASVNPQIGDMTANLLNCSFTNIRGKSEGQAVRIGATSNGFNHTGEVRNIIVSDCILSGGATIDRDVVRIEGNDITQTVFDISFDNCIFTNGVVGLSTGAIEGKIKGVSFSNCVFKPSLDAFSVVNTFSVDWGDNVSVTNCDIYQGAFRAIGTPASVGKSSSNLTITDCRIHDVDGVGAFVNYMDRAIFRDNIWNKKTGGGATTGISIGVNATNTKVYGEIFDGVDTPVINNGTGSYISVAPVEGIYTPTITFDTPGDLNVVYGTQVCNYIKDGKVVQFQQQITFTPTYTTSAGSLRISIPFQSKSGSNIFQPLTVANNNASFTYPAGTSFLSGRIPNGSSYMVLRASGSATGSVDMTVTEITSGATYILNVGGSYITNI